MKVDRDLLKTQMLLKALLNNHFKKNPSTIRAVLQANCDLCAAASEAGGGRVLQARSGEDDVH